MHAPSDPPRAARWGFAFAVLLVACNESDSGAGDSPDTGIAADTAQGGDTTPIGTQDPLPPVQDPTVLPSVGVWEYDGGEITNNTCGEYARVEDVTYFRILSAADGIFAIEQNEPYGDFQCSIQGDQFVCPNRLSGSETNAQANVRVDWSVQVTGALPSATQIDAEQTITFVCEGANCAFSQAVLGVTFPCSWTVPFTARFVL